MDSNESKKVDHELLAEINDLVNDDIELKHESIDENYNSGFLRRPQKFDKVLALMYICIHILQIKSTQRFRKIFAPFI